MEYRRNRRRGHLVSRGETEVCRPGLLFLDVILGSDDLENVQQRVRIFQRLRIKNASGYFSFRRILRAVTGEKGRKPMNRKMLVSLLVMVMGNDDLPLASLLTPGLTTMRGHCKEFGVRGTHLLHQLITRQVQPPIQIKLPFELIVRESA
jgi:hypothetical protein